MLTGISSVTLRISGVLSSFSIAFIVTVWFAASLMEPKCCSVSVGVRVASHAQNLRNRHSVCLAALTFWPMSFVSQKLTKGNPITRKGSRRPSVGTEADPDFPDTVFGRIGKRGFPATRSPPNFPVYPRSGHWHWQRNCPQSKCRTRGLPPGSARRDLAIVPPGASGRARLAQRGHCRSLPPAAGLLLLCAKSRRHLQVSLGRLRLATTTPPRATAATEAEGPRHRPRSKLARLRRADLTLIGHNLREPHG
jgi:hypothetical protein